MDDVRFRLLGPTEILVDGQPARLPGGAERALLVLLLLSPGRSVPASTLIDRLWSETSLPVDPVNALQIRVSKLRRALTAHGVPPVTRDHAGYRLDVDEQAIDAARFATMLRGARDAAAGPRDDAAEVGLAVYDEALALWVGEPLADFPTEAWARQEASRLTGLRLAALTERAQLALALGRHTEVATDLEPVVAADPTLEALAGQLMTALYRGGRQAEALEVFTRTRTVLDDELGLEPSGSLRALHEQVLRQDAALAGPTGGSALLPGGLPGPARSRLTEVRDAPGSLPTVARPLLGRDEQLAELEGLLTSERLVTLVGPGGAGKTSLALAGAIRARDAFPDGAVGVRLAPVADATHVPATVAEALGVPLDGAAAERDVRVRLARFLEHRRVLLLVDNCEHLVDAVATLVDELLGRSEGLTVLATSREALAVPDELQLLVHPLAVPPEGTPAADVLRYPAATLFAERARMLRPGMVLPEDDLRAVARIARALDGLPLAIELAAARVSTMSPGEIATRLGRRFELLTAGARTAESRQQTLRATVDWSYGLLDETQRTVFDRLSVFRGGWTLRAAEEVLDDDDLSAAAVLDTMGRLVERSLLVVEPGATTRYRMLETLREYARERLAAAGLEDRVARRHAQHFLRVTQEGDHGLRGHGQRDALRMLRAEQPNIRAAMSWWVDHDEADAALSMAGALGLFWHLGRHLEGRETLDRVLRLEGGGAEARARALQAVSLVERPRACLVHPSPRCAETAAESLRLFDEVGDASRAALSRVLLAVEGVTGAEPERSRRLLAEAEARFTTDDDPWGRAVIGFVRMETALKGGDEETAVATGTTTATAFRRLDDPWGLSAILYHLGWGLRQFGRYEDGARVLLEAIDVATGAGIFNTVQWALADLGVARLHLGDRDGALDAFARAAKASDEVGDGAGVVLAAYGRGLLAWSDERFDEARPLFSEAAEGFGRLGTPVPQGLAVVGVARCDEEDGELDRAADRLEEALVTGRSTGEGALVAAALEGLARVAARRDDATEARRLADEASVIRLTARRPATPVERRDLAAVLPPASGPTGSADPLSVG
ncbi:AfsR/SARP family transcriptional regulator [Oryzobacter sp. R7]|uniref:AfsR/SARP family transcriptional regulator n=1 Tax=Oryzobacter faecalis TaxID=3388656 RepID=UPI00398D1D31